jgi:hypothetical protein
MSEDIVDIARGSHGEAWYADEIMKEPRLLQHVLADEITRLRAALAIARREGMEEAADLCDDLPDHQGGICAIAIRMMIDEEDKKAAIRAAGEDREP